MKKNNKILSFISLALSLSIIFAGINVHAETTFEKIKRTGKVTVGTEAAFPPFEFVEDGKIVGYGKDILDYIIADLDAEAVDEVSGLDVGATAFGATNTEGSMSEVRALGIRFQTNF